MYVHIYIYIYIHVNIYSTYLRLHVSHLLSAIKTPGLWGSSCTWKQTRWACMVSRTACVWSVRETAYYRTLLEKAKVMTRNSCAYIQRHVRARTDIVSRLHTFPNRLFHSFQFSTLRFSVVVETKVHLCCLCKEEKKKWVADFTFWKKISPISSKSL